MPDNSKAILIADRVISSDQVEKVRLLCGKLRHAVWTSRSVGKDVESLTGQILDITNDLALYDPGKSEDEIEDWFGPRIEKDKRASVMLFCERLEGIVSCTPDSRLRDVIQNLRWRIHNNPETTIDDLIPL